MRTDDPLVSLSLDTFLSNLVRPSIAIASKTLHTDKSKTVLRFVVIPEVNIVPSEGMYIIRRMPTSAIYN